MAASSLVSMFSVLRIDSIVRGDLYRFGLEFSYQWALPYWTMTTIIFAVGWFNIILSFAFQFYVLLYRRKETIAQETPKQLEPTPHIETAKTTHKSDEQLPEKVEAPVEGPQEPMPSQESEQPAENVETTLEEFLQPQTETSAEATNGVVKTDQEEQPSETEHENPVEEQQPEESQRPPETQPTEQQPTTEKPEDTQPAVEVPVEPEEQQPTQTTTSEDTNPQPLAESSQN
jgi:hypothetical protein